MAVEPEVSWALVPLNFILSLGGAFVAGIGIILTFGRKWQTFEDMRRDIEDLKKQLASAKETCSLTDVKLQAEIDTIKENSALYRENAARSYATRDELTQLREKLWNWVKFPGGPAE
jgi:hypothetical protein